MFIIVINKYTHNYSTIYKIQTPLHKYIPECLNIYTHIHYNKQRTRKNITEYIKTLFIFR